MIKSDCDINNEVEKPTALKISHINRTVDVSTSSRNVCIPNPLDGNALDEFRYGQQNVADEHKNNYEPKEHVLKFVAIYNNALQKKCDWNLGGTGAEGSNRLTNGQCHTNFGSVMMIQEQKVSSGAVTSKYNVDNHRTYTK